VAAQDDPAGHYRALGLAPNATQAQISHAYREWAKAFHPDISGHADAHDFHRIKEAYDTLRDEGRRTLYDAVGLGGRPDGSPSDPAAAEAATRPSVTPATAARCSACNAISSQPRYCIFYRVISAIVHCHVERPHGVYCPRCAASRSLRESVISSILGWWSIAGIVQTPAALWRNFWIGEKPRRANARLLITQAQYFLSIRHRVLAQSCLEQAARFAEGKDAETLVSLRQLLGNESLGRTRNDWALYLHPGLYAHALPLLLIAVIALSYNSARSPHEIPPPGSISASTGPPGPLLAPAGPSPIVRDTRHVASVSATIWVVQNGQYTSGGYLPQFTTVVVLGPSSNPDFVAALLPSGQPAILAAAALTSGDGATARSRLCHDVASEPLRNGEVLRKLQSGPNSAVVINNGEDDAMVKFRSPDGVVTVALFVVGQSQAIIEDFPDGSFHFEFATGQHWSRKCGLFEQGMNARRFRSVDTFASREEVEVKQGQHMTVVHPDFAEFTIPPDPDGLALAEPIDQDAFIRD
jgi:DnaJ domain